MVLDGVKRPHKIRFKEIAREYLVMRHVLKHYEIILVLLQFARSWQETQIRYFFLFNQNPFRMRGAFGVFGHVPTNRKLTAHTSFVLFDVTRSPYGINSMDWWSNTWTSGHLLLPHKSTHPLSNLNFFFCNIKYF